MPMTIDRPLFSYKTNGMFCISRKSFGIGADSVKGRQARCCSNQASVRSDEQGNEKGITSNRFKRNQHVLFNEFITHAVITNDKVYKVPHRVNEMQAIEEERHILVFS
jgi:hypothetical protein